tara:strand:- start:2 stop:472 length:471 start_codon:yes stop_codon:yes gene_type:complete
MSAGGASSGGDTNQVSGNEAFYTKQQKQLQKKTMNTDQKVGTYGDTKTGRTFGGEYSKENQNPNNDIQTKKTTTTYNNGGGNGGEGNNTIVNKTVGGTKIQTTETKVEKAADLTAEQIALRNKKRGRASSIMTSSQGVGKTSSNYELGKTSLLGRV